MNLLEINLLFIINSKELPYETADFFILRVYFFSKQRIWNDLNLNVLNKAIVIKFVLISNTLKVTSIKFYFLSCIVLENDFITT